MSVAPDFPEPIVGWRLWLVVSDHGQAWLESVIYPERWPRWRPLHARCLHGRRSQPVSTDEGVCPDAPVESCHCGVYATRDVTMLDAYLEGHYPGKEVLDRVIGLVSLWGAVVECERGWRGEVAYPNAIYVPKRDGSDRGEQSRRLARSLGSYGVPVKLTGIAPPELVCALGPDRDRPGLMASTNPVSAR